MLEELNGDFLQWLRGFYYVAKTGSIRKAAEFMHRNPSTISYQIRALEQELNTVLFDRYKKTLRITPEGKKLLSWTITTFETLQSMRSAVGTRGEHLQGQVRMASTLPFAALGTSVIASFLKEHPKVDLQLIRALPTDVESAVREARVDFGLTGLPQPPDDLHMDVLFKSRPLLVVHREHPWRIPPVPSLEDLQKLPFVSFLPRQEFQNVDPFFGDGAAALDYRRNVVLKVNNFHLILRFVLQKVGVAVLDELSLKASVFGADWSPLISYPLDHLLPNMLYGIILRRRKLLSPQADTLMERLRNHFSGLQLPADITGKKGTE